MATWTNGSKTVATSGGKVTASDFGPLPVGTAITADVLRRFGFRRAKAVRHLDAWGRPVK